MAITLVGWGSSGWQAANNASVTPALPGGLQAGDYVYLFTLIRENGATAPTISGWEQVATRNSPTYELAFAIYRKIYAAGMVAPTVTWTGGGSNDTVLANTLGLRPSLGSIIDLVPMTYQVPETDVVLNTAFYKNQTVLAGPGQLDVLFVGYANDTTTVPAAYGNFYYADPSAGVLPSALNHISSATSALGADASAAVQLMSPQNQLDANDYLYSYLIFDSVNQVASGLSGIRMVLLEPVNVEFTPSGGVNIGGQADTLFVPRGTYLYEGSGGLALGGSSGGTERAEYGLRVLKPQVSGNRKDSVGSVTVSWTSDQLDADSLLVLVAASSQGSFAATDVVPVCPSGWNELPITNMASTKSRLFWKRWTPGDPTSAEVAFSSDQVSSKIAILNFFKNTDWAYASGNPFDAPRNDVGNVTQSYFYRAKTAATSSTVISVIGSSLNYVSYGGGTEWAVLDFAGTAGSGTSSASARLAYKYIPGSRATETQEPSAYLFSFPYTVGRHHIHVSVATLGGASVYSWTPSGGLSIGGSGSYIPPAVPADYPYVPSGGLSIGGQVTSAKQPGSTPRTLQGFSFSWTTAKRIIGASQSRYLLRAGSVSLRVSSLRVVRELQTGNTVEAVVMSVTRPCAVGQDLVAGVATLSASGATLSERLWSARVASVKETAPGSCAWRVQATESGLRGGGMNWTPPRLSMRATYGARSAPDVGVVAGDLHEGRPIVAVTTFIEAGGAGATEVSYG